MIEKSIYNAMNKKGERVNISVSDKKESYCCIGCEHIVIPHQGKKNKWTFHHKANNKCNYSDESLIHKLAKDILFESKCVKTDIGVINATYVEKEVYFNLFDGKGFRPDIVFYDEEKEPVLFIEIIKTNKPDNAKLDKLRTYGLNTLAIHIGMYNNDIENLKHIIVEDLSRKDWIIKNSDYGCRFSIQETRKSEIQILDEDPRKLFNLGLSFKCAIKAVKEFTSRVEKIISNERYRAFIEPYKKEYFKSEEDFAKNKRILERITREAEEYRQMAIVRNEENRQMAGESIENFKERLTLDFKETVRERYRDRIEDFNRRIKLRTSRINSIRREIEQRIIEIEQSKSINARISDSNKNGTNSFLDFY